MSDWNNIWCSYEILPKTGKDPFVLIKVRKQIIAKRILNKKGAVQDKSFIESDSEKFGKLRGDYINARSSMNISTAKIIRTNI